MLNKVFHRRKKVYSIGDRVKAVIQANGLSQNKFAEAIGVSSAAVSNVINNKNKPDIDFVTNTLSRFENLNPDWLLHGKGLMYKEFETPVDGMVSEPMAQYYQLPNQSIGTMLDKKMEWMEQQILELTKQVARLQSA